MTISRRTMLSTVAALLGLAAMPAVSEAAPLATTTNYAVSRFYFDDDGNLCRERHTGLTEDEAFDLSSLPRTAYTSRDCSAGSCGHARGAARGAARVGDRAARLPGKVVKAKPVRSLLRRAFGR